MENVALEQSAGAALTNNEDIRPPAGFTAGSRIAGYLLEERIGQGGMAVVFRAHDERLDRTVALKILAPAFADDDAFRQRFMRESRAAAAVDDPHIIPVYEAGESSGVLFIAMRYVRGGDVGSLHRRAGPLPLARAAGIVSQVASALDAAHARGLVHRDVKPTNMLLDAASAAGRTDHVYLSDFGLSKTSLQVGGLTKSGQFLGTLDYVAPEQIEGKQVDGRADQYALGCAAYELLAGTPPFERGEAMALIYAHLSEPPPPASRRRPDLPSAVDAVLARALRKAPADRYRTCTEFAEAFSDACRAGRRDTGVGRTAGAERPATEVAWAGQRGWGSEQTVAAATPEATMATTGPAVTGTGGAPPARRPRRRFVTVAVALTVLAVAVAAAALISAHTSSPGQPVIQAAARCAKSAHGTPVDPLAFKPGPVLADSGAGQPIVEGAAFSPDNSELAVADHNGITYLWNPATGTLARELTDPFGRGIQSVAFSCDGRSVAIGDNGGAAVVWNAAATTGNPLTGPGSKKVLAVAFNPRAPVLAAGDSNGNTYLWNLKTGSYVLLANPGGAANAVQAVAFSPDGTMLATGDSNGSTYLWNAASHRLIARLADSSGGSNGVQAVAFSPDGRTVAAGDSNGTSYLWNTAGHGVIRTLPDPSPAGAGVVAIAYSLDGGTLASGDANGSTYLWNTASGHLVNTLPGPAIGGFGVQALAFSPNGRYLAVGNVNGRTYLWTR